MQGETLKFIEIYVYLHEFALSLNTVLPSDNKSQRNEQFLNFILVKNSTCFRQIYCPSSGVLILYSQKLVYVILVMLTSASEVRMEL